MSNWISIADNLPSEEGTYIIIIYNPVDKKRALSWDTWKSPGSFAYTDIYTGKEKENDWFITHWLPTVLPPFPKNP